MIKVIIQCGPFHIMIYWLVHLFLFFYVYLALFEKLSPRICVICPYRILHFIYCCLVGHLYIHAIHWDYLWFLFVHKIYLCLTSSTGVKLTSLKITRHIHGLLYLLLIICNTQIVLHHLLLRYLLRLSKLFLSIVHLVILRLMNRILHSLYLT